jgi:hypothetical protein
MSIRHNRQTQAQISARRALRAARRPRDRRRTWARWSAVLLLLALALVAFLAPAGQAQGAGEHSLEAKSGQESTGGKKNSEEPEHVEVAIGCTGVTWKYMNFPAEGTTTVTETVTIDKVKQPSMQYSFSGATGENTTAFAAPPGEYTIDVQGNWKNPTGSEKEFGHFDIHEKVRCAPAPAFTIEKLQQIASSGEPYTSATLTGQLGDTVNYEIVVENTGNVPLTLEDFTDTHCDPDTLSGGSVELAVGASTTYDCTHLLDETDQSGGLYANTASVTGTPPEGDGSPILHASNTVVVEVPPTPPTVLPAFSIEKLQQIAGGGGSYTTSQLTGSVGQTVDYEIVVRNTGNVPLKLEDFTDTHCDAGTLSGGPDSALPTGAATTYDCAHVLDEADRLAGSYSNTASVTGMPAVAGSAPIAGISNTVVVAVPTPPQGNTNPATGVLPSSLAGGANSGVLAFKAASAPALNGPQGCVRSRFHVSIKSAGVASVTFYLDGHKLKTLTAKNAHKGLLTIEINPAKLKVGAHKLVAKITMARTATTKATVVTRKVTILRCHGAAVTPKFTG